MFFYECLFIFWAILNVFLYGRNIKYFLNLIEVRPFKIIKHQDEDEHMWI